MHTGRRRTRDGLRLHPRAGAAPRASAPFPRQGAAARSHPRLVGRSPAARPRALEAHGGARLDGHHRPRGVRRARARLRGSDRRPRGDGEEPLPGPAARDRRRGDGESARSAMPRSMRRCCPASPPATPSRRSPSSRRATSRARRARHPCAGARRRRRPRGREALRRGRPERRPDPRRRARRRRRQPLRGPRRHAGAWPSRRSSSSMPRSPPPRCGSTGSRSRRRPGSVRPPARGRHSRARSTV